MAQADDGEKKPCLLKCKSVFCAALPIFPCRQSIVPPMAEPDVLSMICKKSACRWQADFLCWRYLSSRAVTRKVLSAKVSLTSVFGMGTGEPSPQSTPTSSKHLLRSGCTLKTEHEFLAAIQGFESAFSNCRSSPRLISISQLHALPRFHL